MSKRHYIAATIVFVCLLSFVLPVLASIGFPKVEIETKDIDYDVIGLEVDSGILQAGSGVNYVKYDQTKGVTEGVSVTFMVVFKIPMQAHDKAVKLLDGNTLYIEATNLRPEASATCLVYTTDEDGNAYPLAPSDTATISEDDFSELPVELNRDLAGKLTWAESANISIANIEERDLTLFVLYQGYAIDQRANAVISTGWKSTAGKLSVNGSLFIKSNGKDYLVCHSKASRSIYGSRLTALNPKTDHVFDILIQSGDNAGTTVAFFCRDTDGCNYEILDIAIDTTSATKLTSLTGRTYKVGFTEDGSVDFTPYKAGLGWLTDSHGSYSVLKGILDEVFGVFGWSYDGSLGVLNDEGFSDYSSAKNFIYYAYTERLTLPGTAQVPDTGTLPLWLPALLCAAFGAAATFLAIKRNRAK